LHVKIEFCADSDCTTGEVSVAPYGVNSAGPVKVDGTCVADRLAHDASVTCTDDRNFWLSAFYALPVVDSGPLPQSYRLTVTDLASGDTVLDRAFEAKYTHSQPTRCDENSAGILCADFEQRF
jgi:hypothetical protein